jgi:hypothetical protein
MKKYLRATQMLWMILAIVAAITTIYMFITNREDNSNAIFCMMITLFCAVMWNMRRMFNNKIEREMKKREENRTT